VKAVLKCESEPWVLNEREKQRLETEQMRFLRPLLGYTKLDRQRNVEISEQFKVQTIAEGLERRCRKDAKWEFQKLVLKYKPVEKRSAGRPKKTRKYKFMEES
jgi:hypothetical protein